MNAVDTDGLTPLFYAIVEGRLECTKVLLAAGATVNHRRTDGDNPLDLVLVNFYGSAKARAKIVELLEAAGALTAAQLPDDDDDDEVDDEDA